MLDDRDQIEEMPQAALPVEDADPAAPPEPAPILITDDMLTPEPPRDPRKDFERGMSMLPMATIILMITNVAIFIWQVAAGTLLNEQTIIAAGALVRERVVSGGEGWRLGSAMFLHGSFDHLIGNMIVLYILGVACEHAYGWRRMLGLYLAAGLTGALLSMAMSPGPSVGASGAIFGLCGGVITFLYRHQEHFFLRDKRIGFVLAFWAVYTIATGFLTPFVDNFAHIGGALGGAAAALVLRSPLVQRVHQEKTLREKYPVGRDRP
ncbi:rhomboid family intramembrane serine protease [bacterium]|nr:rhomboid family intramembrane serine protease [bacterium]